MELLNTILNVIKEPIVIIAVTMKILNRYARR